MPGDGFMSSPLGINSGPLTPETGSMNGDFGGPGELGSQIENLSAQSLGVGMDTSVDPVLTPYQGPGGMADSFLKGSSPIAAWNHTNQMLDVPVPQQNPTEISAFADQIMREHLGTINPDFFNLTPSAQAASIKSALEPHVEAVSKSLTQPVSQFDFDSIVLSSFEGNHDFLKQVQPEFFNQKTYDAIRTDQLAKTAPIETVQTVLPEITPQQASEIKLPTMQQVQQMKAQQVVLPTMDEVRAQNAQLNQNPQDVRGIQVGNQKYSIPVQGTRISSEFGMRKHPVTGGVKMHKGIDFAAPKGTSINSFTEGEVLRAGKAGAYGNLVEIKHPDGMITRYAHMDKIDPAITKGTKVSAGTFLGNVGATGRVTGPHLHFETLINGKQVNPRQFLDLKKK